MSKFAKPKPAGAITQADIDRVIEGADAVDDRKAEPKTAEDVRFTMTLDSETAGRVDQARKKAGRLTRLSWIRMPWSSRAEAPVRPS